MNKDTLDKAVEACKDETRVALQTFYDALNHGQQKQIIKNETVKAICDRFGVEYIQ